MTKRLKTITIGAPDDNPLASLCPGHVTHGVWNKAHRAEGWHGDYVPANRLEKEYWIRAKKRWKRSTKETKNAKPFTVLYW